VIGIVTRADLGESQRFGVLASVRHTWLGRRRASEPTVGKLMTAHVRTVDATTPIAELVPIFADYGHHHIPVLNGQGRQLAGMVTQADLIAGLHRQAQTQHQRAA